MTASKSRRQHDDTDKPPRCLDTTNQFNSDVVRMARRGLPLCEIKTVIDLLLQRKLLDRRYRDHKLNDSKEWKNCRELHIQPDWLLIYRTSADTLLLLATGTHADLYD